MLSFFVILLNIFLLCFGEDWCKVGLVTGHCDPKKYSGADPSKHIFCLYPSPGFNSKVTACRDVVSKTNDVFRRKMLNLHNDFRNKWANGEWMGQKAKGFCKVSNMRYLTYDMELEKMAQQFADNCHDYHEGCRAVERYGFGQNLAWSWANMKKAILDTEKPRFLDWVNEFNLTHQEDEIHVQFEPYAAAKVQIGHFTAAVWGETYRVGCAQTHYYDLLPDRARHPLCALIVCDYAPTGNLNGFPLYIPGEPGTNCPRGTVAGYFKQYPYLCGSASSPTDKPFDSPNVSDDGKPSSGISKKNLCIFAFVFSWEFLSSAYIFLI